MILVLVQSQRKQSRWRAF